MQHVLLVLHALLGLVGASTPSCFNLQPAAFDEPPFADAAIQRTGGPLFVPPLTVKI